MEHHADKRLRLQRLFALPPPPAAAQRVLEVLFGERADAEALAEAFKLCPGLSARIIGLANTAYYGTRPVYGLKEAIVRIGLNAVKGLAFSILLGETFSPKGRLRFSMERYWLQALTAAACCAELARRSRQAIPEDQAYLAGLLHNFGLLVLLCAFPEAMEKVIEHPPPWEEAERELLGIDHHEAAAWVLYRWHLPRDMVLAVEHWCEEGYRGEAWELARLLGWTVGWMEGGFQETSPPEGLGLSEEDLEGMGEACQRKREKLAAIAARLAGS